MDAMNADPLKDIKSFFINTITTTPEKIQTAMRNTVKLLVSKQAIHIYWEDRGATGRRV